jgi:prevent-host-death family protein
MEKVGVRELRQNASKYLARVKKGESLEITERGIPVAVLSPAAKLSLYDRLVAEGKLIPAQGKLQEWLKAHAVRPTSDTGMSASEALEEQRQERL